MDMDYTIIVNDDLCCAGITDYESVIKTQDGSWVAHLAAASQTDGSYVITELAVEREYRYQGFASELLDILQVDHVVYYDEDRSKDGERWRINHGLDLRDP